MFVKELVNINSYNEVNIKVIVAMKYSAMLQDQTTYLEKQQPTISNETYIFIPLKQSWKNNITIAFWFPVLKHVLSLISLILKKWLQKLLFQQKLQIAINLDAVIQLTQWIWFGPLLVSSQQLLNTLISKYFSLAKNSIIANLPIQSSLFIQRLIQIVWRNFTETQTWSQNKQQWLLSTGRNPKWDLANMGEPSDIKAKFRNHIWSFNNGKNEVKSFYVRLCCCIKLRGDLETTMFFWSDRSRLAVYEKFLFAERSRTSDLQQHP